MTMPSVNLLTTCHVRNDGLADLFGLVASVQAALDDGEIECVRHIVLLQGCSSAECAEIELGLPRWVELYCTEASLPSSLARNLLIRRLVDDVDFDPVAFVGFPDDDAWYPSGGLGCVARHFRDSADLQLLLSRYGPSPSAEQRGKAFRPTLQQALSRGACAAIFLRAGLVAQLGGFHELLGLGSKLSGGEDTEFVHRAFQRAGGQALCVPGFIVGHAASNPQKKAQYYEGGLAAIMAHSQTSAAARLALIRKLAVGLGLVLRHRLSLSRYFRAVRRAHGNAQALRNGQSLSRSPERPQQSKILKRVGIPDGPRRRRPSQSKP